MTSIELHSNLRRVDNFSSILSALSRNGFSCRDFIDGGAGAGHTAASMLKDGSQQSVCYAFEPFVGNHRFFDGKDPRIRLFKCALGNYNGTGSFLVSSVVEENSEWGQRGMVGYSSVGHLAKQGFIKWLLLRLFRQLPPYQRVDVMKGDDVIPGTASVDFIKLDLQGGELEALKGMEQILKQASILWIEYSGDYRLLEFLRERDFCLFDTPYLFKGHPDDELGTDFEVAREIGLSTGKAAFSAVRLTPWSDYASEFNRLTRHNQLMQTDIVAVRSEKHQAVVDAFPLE